MKKPRDYKRGKWQKGQCLKSFELPSETIPKSVWIHCEEMTASDCRKLSKWLIECAKWMEGNKKNV
jgi:hypothetical protein